MPLTRSQAKKLDEQQTFSCGLCTSADNDEMIQCDKCKIRYHLVCVDSSFVTREERWICPTCETNDRTTSEITVQQQQSNTSVNRNRIPRVEQSSQQQEELQVPARRPQINARTPVTEFQNLSNMGPSGTGGSRSIVNNDFISNSLYAHRAHYRQVTAPRLVTPLTTQRLVVQRQMIRIENPNRFIHSTPTSNQQMFWPQQQFDQRHEFIAWQPNYQNSPSHQEQERRISNERQQNSERSRTNTPNSDRQYVSARQELASSVRSSSTRSSAHRIQIQLQKLEEERRVREEYIDKKYRILMQDCERDDTTDRRSFTENWVNNISNNRIDDFETTPPLQNDFRTRSLGPRSSTKMESISEKSEAQPDPAAQRNFTKVKLEDNETQLDPVASQNFTANANVPKFDRDDDVANLMFPQSQSTVLNKSQIAARHVVTRDLPVFDGNPEDWLMFYSRYRNSTNLCGYTDAENLDRLQKCLKGRALESVKHRLLMPESLPGVLSTLKLLFGRPEFVVNHLVKKISQLPPPKMDKLDTVVDFAMAVQNVSATIKSVELNEHLSNPTLMTGLVNKLPVNIRLDWAKFKLTQSIVTLSTLADWLYALAEVVASVTEPVFTYSDDKKTTVTQSKGSSEFQRKKSEYVNTHHEQLNLDVQSKSKEKEESIPASRQNQNKSCLICQKNCPNVAECNVFKSNEVSQRWKMVNNKKLCRTCLRLHFGFCRIKKSCGVNGCSAKHHPTLHDEQRIANKAENQQHPPEVNSFHSLIKINERVLLRIIPVKLFSAGRSILTFAFIDEGSTTSLIDQRICERLNIKGIPKELCLLWSGRIHRTEKNSQEITVQVSSTNDDSIKYHLKRVKTVENLGIPSQSLNKQELCQKFPYLQDVPFESYDHGLPGILIGANNARIGIPIEVVEGGDSEPIACRTRIGWTIHGPTSKFNPAELEWETSNPHSVEECSCDHDHDKDLHQYVKDYFSVENFGVKVNHLFNNDSKDDERATDQLKKFTRKVENRYESGLLWRHDQFDLPDSYGMALRRLQCLENRHPETVEVINKTIIDYVAKGYVTKLTVEEAEQNSRRVWYLPIFTVTYPKKPDKIRTVFDAAAKVNGVSLNSLLLKGPDQLVSMVDILRRFREKRVAACGDIKEMYHQIQTRTEDKNCQRFLWRNGENRKPDVYVMNVMTFGATCSPCIAHYVKNLNASKFAKEFPQAVETITKNHYVDDMMETAHSDNAMIKLINEVKMIHREGGFEIRNFLSNSKEVSDVVRDGVNLHDKEKTFVPEKDVNIERVLGLWWNTDIDCFTFSLKYSPLNKEILLGERLPTKRELLKLLMSIFDPLGLISHFLIHLKMIIQEIWRSELHWDQQIHDIKLVKQWERWLNLLPKVEDIKIPRLYTLKLSPKVSENIELHMFVDASEDAFGAVGYLRVEDEDGVDCSLIGSKSRVAPIKYLSIPRKELQAAVLGTRLSSSIVSSQNLKINRTIFWSDSKTVLSWLQSDHRKYHQFVAHRVGEILEGTELNDWRWIPSKLNVADEMTKWEKIPSFELASRWFRGPEFLKLSEDNWPRTSTKFDETEEEMKLNFVHSTVTVVRLVDPKRFSNWNRMVRSLAYVIRYVRILRDRIRKVKGENSHLSQAELALATNKIFQQVQFDEYPEEIVSLMLNRDRLPSQQKFIDKSSPIYTLSPYLDHDGILRIRGRIDLAENVPHDMKRPIILPRQHPITKLLVKHYHRIYHHRNNETVVNELRQKYYIPKMRVVLKSIIKSECQACKNRKVKPESPEMASLPFGRLAVGLRPFTHTGIDYFGPIEVVIGRRVEKRWGVIFTCLTVRAVHIEISHSLDTESFIKCLRNFIALRGRPSETYSDKGTNFVGADNELAKEVAKIDFEKVATEFTTSYSKWNFNPPHAPHFGGAWERLVCSIKTSLAEVMTERRPSDETLRNLLMEVQNVINSRPLTYIPLDNDNDEAITPNHFILGSSNGIKPPGVFSASGQYLKSAWRENQRITDLFWKRFIKEYLPTLTRRTKWFQPVKPLAIGDIGIDFDNNYERNRYPKVRIIDRTMDRSGQVRRVKCQFANGSILWRPASSVARLDIFPKDSTPTSEATKVQLDSSQNKKSTTTQQKVPSTNSLTTADLSSETEGNVANRRSARIAAKESCGTGSAVIERGHNR